MDNGTNQTTVFYILTVIHFFTFVYSSTLHTQP